MSVESELASLRAEVTSAKAWLAGHVLIGYGLAFLAGIVVRSIL